MYVSQVSTSVAKELRELVMKIKGLIWFHLKVLVCELLGTMVGAYGEADSLQDAKRQKEEMDPLILPF